MWWGPDITPGGSEKQWVDTQRESGDLLVTYAWYQLPKLKAHSRVNWVAPLRCTFISPQTRRKQGCSACSKLQVWKGRRSTLETTHLKDCQLNQFSVSTKSCNIHLSTWPSTCLYMSDEVSENSFFTASLGHFSFCVTWGAVPHQFPPRASYIFPFSFGQKTASSSMWGLTCNGQTLPRASADRKRCSTLPSVLQKTSLLPSCVTNTLLELGVIDTFS